MVDNVLWHGDVINHDDHSADTEAIREFNRKIHTDSRVTISLATVGDGLMLACKV
jgi:predicted O-methyltransferase YrrM